MNRFDPKHNKRRGQLFALLAPTVAFCLVVGLALAGIGGVGKLTGRGEAERLEKTIARSAVHCYALEGCYPESIAYLAEHYGLRYDTDRYAVDYYCFAQNLMPEITVVEKHTAP